MQVYEHAEVLINGRHIDGSPARGKPMRRRVHTSLHLLARVGLLAFAEPPRILPGSIRSLRIEGRVTT